jgi:exodeoxyribonuclease VII small subunit
MERERRSEWTMGHKIINLTQDIMAKKEFSFNQAVNEIEKILRNIENGDLDVDRLSIEVKRASELIRQCQKKLRSTEEEINSIFKDLV